MKIPNDVTPNGNRISGIFIAALLTFGTATSLAAYGSSNCFQSFSNASGLLRKTANIEPRTFRFDDIKPQASLEIIPYNINASNGFWIINGTKIYTYNLPSNIGPGIDIRVDIPGIHPFDMKIGEMQTITHDDGSYERWIASFIQYNNHAKKETGNLKADLLSANDINNPPKSFTQFISQNLTNLDTTFNGSWAQVDRKQLDRIEQLKKDRESLEDFVKNQNSNNMSADWAVARQKLNDAIKSDTDQISSLKNEIEDKNATIRLMRNNKQSIQEWKRLSSACAAYNLEGAKNTTSGNPSQIK